MICRPESRRVSSAASMRRDKARGVPSPTSSPDSPWPGKSSVWRISGPGRKGVVPSQDRRSEPKPCNSRQGRPSVPCERKAMASSMVRPRSRRAWRQRQRDRPPQRRISFSVPEAGAWISMVSLGVVMVSSVSPSCHAVAHGLGPAIDLGFLDFVAELRHHDRRSMSVSFLRVRRGRGRGRPSRARRGGWRVGRGTSRR